MHTINRLSNPANKLTPTFPFPTEAPLETISVDLKRFTKMEIFSEY